MDIQEQQDLLIGLGSGLALGFLLILVLIGLGLLVGLRSGFYGF